MLATNIAESSITIDDVVYVIDCGKAKETSYDALNKLACLLPSWISKASAHQVCREHHESVKANRRFFLCESCFSSFSLIYLLLNWITFFFFFPPFSSVSFWLIYGE